VAGAVRVDDAGDPFGPIHAGEVVELRVQSMRNVSHQLRELCAALRAHHLHAVPVGRLLRDSGTPV
jgi:hypothetical protein